MSNDRILNGDMLKDLTSNKILQYEFNRFDIPLHFIGFDEDFIKPSKKGMYVFNLGDRMIGGTHWTGLWYENGKSYYFDSFGFRPSKTILKVIGKNPFWNDEMFQDPSEGLCGLYQFIFGYYMNKHKRISPVDRYKKFISLFDPDDLERNQKTIVREYRRLFN